MNFQKVIQSKLQELKKYVDIIKSWWQWGEKWSSPFISRKVYDKIEKKWYREFKKFFKEKKKIFNDRYKELKWGVDFLWNMDRSVITKKELMEEDFFHLIEWLFLPDEFYNLFFYLFVASWDEFFEEISKNIENFGIEIETKPNKISQKFIEKITKYYKLLSERYVVKINWDLRDIIIFWFAEWKSNEKIRREIASKLEDYSLKRAYWIARTETNRIANWIQKDYYEQLWVKKYNVLPAIDACSKCKAKAERNPYRIDDDSWRPPFHPNCRCTIVPVI